MIDKNLISRAKHGDIYAQQQIIDKYKPYIYKKISGSTINIPNDLLEISGVQAIRDAIKAYDPNSGTQFSTFVWRYLESMKRTTYKYGAPTYIPEQRIFNLKNFNDTVEELKNKYSREPTLTEIADKMKLPISEVKNLSASSRKSFYIGDIMPEIGINRYREYALYLKPFLNKDDQKILDDMVLADKGMPVTKMAKKLHMSIGRVSQRKHAIMKKILDLANKMEPNNYGY